MSMASADGLGPGRVVIVEDDVAPEGFIRPKHRPAVLIAMREDGCWLAAALTSRSTFANGNKRSRLLWWEAAGIIGGQPYFSSTYLRVVPPGQLLWRIGWVHPNDARHIGNKYHLVEPTRTDLVVNSMLHH